MSKKKIEGTGARNRPIVDAFLFFEEIEMLKMRLAYLKDYVDMFVIVECDRDHNNRPHGPVLGNNKPLLASLCAEYPIVYVLVTDLPDGPDNWTRVRHHRNCILRGLDGLPDNAIIMVSDLDEFPRRELLGGLSADIDEFGTVGFYNDMFYYEPTTQFTEGGGWTGTKCATLAYVREQGPEFLRSKVDPAKNYHHGGWHFSYFGGVERVKHKIESIAEATGMATPEVTNPENIKRRMRERVDLYDRPMTTLSKVALDPTMPQGIEQFILSNRDKMNVYIHHDYPTQPDHLGGHGFMTNMDTPLLDWLIQRFQPKEFIDLGCGEGGMVRAARDRGLWAIGIDGDPAVYPNILHDFTRPIDSIDMSLIGRGYMDRTAPEGIHKLAWCVEFAEHVEEQYIGNWLPVLAAADVIFFSHALPGQGGHFHVTERHNDFWQGHMATIGFVRDEEATFAARDVATNKYTKTTGMVFVREKEEGK